MKTRKIRSWWAVMLLSAVLLSLLAGCAGVSVRSKQELGLPIYPPTNPVSVQILREMPNRPFQKLGEIAAEPYNNPPVEKIEQKLREAAAAMGADAVVVQMDRTMATGLFVPGRWGGGTITPDMQRIIIGAAIKYTSP